jgi:hypothetical protein
MVLGSMKSKPIELSGRDLIILAASVVLCAAIYLFASRLTYAIGFPLDDAWIHQTYARNLALRGEWAFRPGILSAGSTSPLWSVLLAPGFILGLSPYIWTYLLGMLVLWTLSVVGESAARRLVASYVPRFPWIGLFFVFEWHIAWAALSGMETLLHGLCMTVAIFLLMAPSRRYLTLGLLTGLSVWIRPDGLTLMGPTLLVILLVEQGFRSRTVSAIRYLIGFGSIFLFYLLFNLAIGGTPMPNTFYAKQAEYAAWQARPAVERLSQLVLQLLAGPGLVLVPGAIIWLIASLRQRDWRAPAAALWCGGYMWLYTSRLPVYQHGRYEMPAMPVFFLFGLFGLLSTVNQAGTARFDRIIKTVWISSLTLLTTAFFFLGARSYAQDVAVIESEMVQTAKWAATNLPPDSLIAAHDIGALGYYDEHPLLDLAGLISPEVIPFIRDETRLAAYLDKRGADYLIAFPEFYPVLSKDAEIVFKSAGPFAPRFGQQNMTIYGWKSP